MNETKDMCNGIDFFMEESKKAADPRQPAMDLRVKLRQLYMMAEMPTIAKRLFEEALGLVSELEKENTK